MGTNLPMMVVNILLQELLTRGEKMIYIKNCKVVVYVCKHVYRLLSTKIRRPFIRCTSSPKVTGPPILLGNLDAHLIHACGLLKLNGGISTQHDLICLVILSHLLSAWGIKRRTEELCLFLIPLLG